MKGRYSIEGRSYADTDDAFQSALSYAHSKRIRPLCQCSKPPIAMYVARIDGRFLIKRMPGSGRRHQAMCPSYEPPPELSGLGKVLGSAITDEGDAGETLLRVGFSLTKRPAPPAAPTPGVGSDTVKADASKLTLKSFFHYLWDQAEFTRWSPRMEGKRTWFVIHRHLMEAAHGKAIKGQDLSSVLYVPEPWSKEAADAIKQRRTAMLAGITSGNKGTHSKKIVIGEFKNLEPSRFGEVLTIKHAPGWGIYMTSDVADRIRKRFALELELAEMDRTLRLMAIATFSLSPSRQAKLDEIALIVCTRTFIPVESADELILITKLVEEQRYFCKGLRYNLLPDEPLAAAVLQDSHAVETALYVVPRGTDETYAEALEHLTAQSELASWIWDPEKHPSPPALPATGQEDCDRNYQKADQRSAISPWNPKHGTTTEKSVADTRTTASIADR